MRFLFVAAISGAALVLSGCGGTSAHRSAKASPHCPAAWKLGWQRLANQVRTPVYCPSWMPAPLVGQIGAPNTGRYVEPDHSYLVTFIWFENSAGRPQEVHVNFRGYPGRTAIPICEDTLTVKGKTVHPKIPCFADARGQKRFGDATATVYTANQGADQWHVLYAWRHGGSLYTLSEHVAPPYTYRQVVRYLDRMMRGLVLLRPV